MEASVCDGDFGKQLGRRGWRSQQLEPILHDDGAVAVFGAVLVVRARHKLVAIALSRESADVCLMYVCAAS